MRSTPRLPDERANVSERHPLGEALTLIAGLVFVLLVFIFAAGFLVDTAAGWIPPEKETTFFKDLGDLLAPELSADSAKTLEKIQPIFDKLAAQWEDAPYTFKLGVIESEHPNAMALPGGTILLTTSLLETSKSENELALVLGHELGHFKNRDHLRRLGRVVLINLFIGVLFGTQAGAEGDELVALVTQLKQGSFSRDQELAADRFGLELVQKRFGHVAGSWRFFKRIGEMPETPSELGSYFSTHPHPENRIKKLKELAREKGWSSTGALSPLPVD